ncbi:hypothetical protein FOL47_003876 [Perkinsus chesapeaki]|uniref:Uncharacterized protein n=1 Tax=Perkinsus chesapeaki TaxID=330153 RepID=A0A7J6M5Q6_PERCH|nr:hypothetical protein FOL47_003876 [Perkinsus chesapeaki]
MKIPSLCTLVATTNALQRLGSSLADDQPWADGLVVEPTTDGLICRLESAGYTLAISLDNAKVLVQVPGQTEIRTEVAFPDDDPKESNEDRCVDAINNLEGDILESDTIETVMTISYKNTTRKRTSPPQLPTFNDLPDLALALIFAMSGQPLVCSMLSKRALYVCDMSTADDLLWRGCSGGRLEYARRLRDRRNAVASKLRKMQRKDLLPNLPRQCDFLHLHNWRLNILEADGRDCGPFKHVPVEWTFELSDPGPFVVSAPGTVFRLTFSVNNNKRLKWASLQGATFTLIVRSAALLGVEAQVCSVKPVVISGITAGCEEVILASVGHVAVGVWSSSADPEVAVIYLNLSFYDIVKAFGLSPKPPAYRLKGIPDDLDPLAGLKGLTVIVALRDGATVMFSNTFYRVDAEECFTELPEPSATFRVLSGHRSGQPIDFPIDGSLRLAWKTRAFRRFWDAVTVDVIVFNEEQEVLWSTSEVAALQSHPEWHDDHDAAIDFDLSADGEWNHHYVRLRQSGVAAFEAHAAESPDGRSWRLNSITMLLSLKHLDDFYGTSYSHDKAIVEEI